MSWLIPAGLLAAILLLLVALSRSRRESDRLEQENQKLARDSRQLLDFMHHMTEALGEGLSHQELRQRIVHASILCTGALSACFFERTPRNTMRGVAVEGLFPPHRPMTEATQGRLLTRARFIEQVLRSEEFPVGEGVVGRVAEQLRGELLVDAAADPRMVRHDDPALKVRSVIVVPLLFRGRSFGVLAVANPGSAAYFNQADFTLLQSLAEQAALALHNAEFLHLQVERRQLDVDLSVARGIQQMLLPRETPSLPGLELDARYAAAQQVGGDLYDFILLPDSRLGIVVADVAGKGIAASMLMAICRTNFRQIASRHVSPAAALTELNRTQSVDIHAGLYVTMIYAIVDAAQNTVTFARAGHELPLFVRRDPGHGPARADYVASEGMALGLVPDEIFAPTITDQTEAFALGDVMLLYTDGVTEAPNEDGKEFSGARLADVARMLHHRPAREVNDHVLEALQRFSGHGPQRDDLTLVTVRRTAG
jgi:sigma-B regulation protein RsbU (phosphoserine phosphatase)